MPRIADSTKENVKKQYKAQSKAIYENLRLSEYEIMKYNKA